MNDDGADVPQSWDTYWHGANTSAAFSSGGSNHPVIQSFWREYFDAIRIRYDGLRIIDIASGNGAVVEVAQSVLGHEPRSFSCVDISEAAIAMLQRRFPRVSALVADAASIPLDSGGFDVVTSQFGVEYAGAGAIDEAVRLLAPGGELALLLHHRDGGIYAQCDASRNAVAAVRKARFLPLCRVMFETGFAALAGGDPERYRAAGREFAPALRAVEAVLGQYGRDVADGTIVRLYQDVRTMHGRMKHYEPAEVLDWLTRMEQEIDAFGARMNSMCEVAIDERGFDALCARLRELGMTVLRAEGLILAERDLPLAWVLIARK